MWTPWCWWPRDQQSSKKIWWGSCSEWWNWRSWWHSWGLRLVKSLGWISWTPDQPVPSCQQTRKHWSHTASISVKHYPTSGDPADSYSHSCSSTSKLQLVWSRPLATQCPSCCTFLGVRRGRMMHHCNFGPCWRFAVWYRKGCIPLKTWCRLWDGLFDKRPAMCCWGRKHRGWHLSVTWRHIQDCRFLCCPAPVLLQHKTEECWKCRHMGWLAMRHHLTAETTSQSEPAVIEWDAVLQALAQPVLRTTEEGNTPQVQK